MALSLARNSNVFTKAGKLFNGFEINRDIYKLDIMVKTIITIRGGIQKFPEFEFGMRI